MNVHDDPHRESTPSGLAEGWRVVAESAAPARLQPRASDAVDTENREENALSNAALMVLGMFGGLYLLYAWGWFVTADAYALINTATASGSGALGGVLQQVIYWVAPLAPIAWFLVVFVRTRGLATSRLVIGLLIGAVVTVPFPVFLGGGA